MSSHRAPVSTVLSHALVPLLLGAVMALAYLGGFHKPEPRDVRVDVVGTTAQTRVFAQTVQDALGDRVSVRVTPTVEDARAALRDQAVAGAYLPDPRSPRLLVSGAASDTTALAVERMFAPVALAQHLPLTVEDVVPTTADDPSGQSLFFYLVALTVGGYGLAIAVAAAGASRPLRSRLALGAAAAGANAVVVTGIAHLVFDAVGGHPLAVGALALVYSLAVMAFGIGLHPLLGRFTTAAMVVLFVALNFTSSGGVFAPALQPRFFEVLHDFWIGSGLLEATRKIAYFPDAALGGDVAKLVGWLAAGALLVLVGWLRERAATEPAPVESAEELELEENLAAV